MKKTEKNMHVVILKGGLMNKPTRNDDGTWTLDGEIIDHYPTEKEDPEDVVDDPPEEKRT